MFDNFWMRFHKSVPRTVAVRRGFPPPLSRSSPLTGVERETLRRRSKTKSQGPLELRWPYLLLLHRQMAPERARPGSARGSRGAPRGAAASRPPGPASPAGAAGLRRGFLGGEEDAPGEEDAKPEVRLPCGPWGRGK